MEVATQKTCPHCRETDLMPDAVICKHCGRNVQSFAHKPVGWVLLGALLLVGGLSWWPLAILGLLCLILGANARR